MNLEQTKPVHISKLEGIWLSLHPYARSKRQAQSVHAAFRRFADFIAGKRQFVHEVTLQDVSEFFASISQQFAHSSARRTKLLLKSAFDGALPSGAKNYFALLKLRRRTGSEVIHRRPLSEAELKRLLAESTKDPLLHFLAVSIACTGMRLGDACLLRWDSVDLANEVIEVTTRKTRAQVIIPILPRFRVVLESALAERKDNDEFVFPDAARLYKEKYSTLIRMGKLLFARVLFADEAKRNNANVTTKYLLRLTRQKREVGKSASLYGWHSIRATFVTLALMRKVPIEMVRRIVGHTTADMTMVYFRPTKFIVAETLRQQMAGSVLCDTTAALPREIEDQRFIKSAKSPAPWPQSCPDSCHQTTTVLNLSIPFSMPKMSKPSIRSTSHTFTLSLPSPIHDEYLRQAKPQMHLIRAAC